MKQTYCKSKFRQLVDLDSFSGGGSSVNRARPTKSDDPLRARLHPFTAQYIKYVTDKKLNLQSICDFISVSELEDRGRQGVFHTERSKSLSKHPLYKLDGGYLGNVGSNYIHLQIHLESYINNSFNRRDTSAVNKINLLGFSKGLRGVSGAPFSGIKLSELRAITELLEEEITSKDESYLANSTIVQLGYYLMSISYFPIYTLVDGLVEYTDIEDVKQGYVSVPRLYSTLLESVDPTSSITFRTGIPAVPQVFRLNRPIYMDRDDEIAVFEELHKYSMVPSVYMSPIFKVTDATKLSAPPPTVLAVVKDFGQHQFTNTKTDIFYDDERDDDNGWFNDYDYHNQSRMYLNIIFELLSHASVNTKEFIKGMSKTGKFLTFNNQ